MVLSADKLKSSLGNIIDDDDVLERYIPVTVERIVEDLIHREQNHDGGILGDFFQSVMKLYHASMYHELRRLQSRYLPFNPDRDTKILATHDEAELEHFKKDLFERLAKAMDKANFEDLSMNKVNEALTQKSPYGVQVSVDLSDFEHIRLYYRGTATRRLHLRPWKQFFRLTTLEIPIYRRLAVMLQTRKKQGENQQLYLKIFKNIPQSDLEMLFPNTKIRMTLFDKIKLSITGGGGTISGIVAMASKLAVALNPWTIFIAVAGFAAVVWRQVTNVFFQRTKYMAQMARNLYFFNLTNNMGAMSYLVDLAVMEECKEVILAYAMLLRHPNLTQAQLDKHIEEYIGKTYGVAINYEVKDGVRKLSDLGLLDPQCRNVELAVIPPDNALHVMENNWRNSFPG